MKTQLKFLAGATVAALALGGNAVAQVSESRTSLYVPPPAEPVVMATAVQTRPLDSVNVKGARSSLQTIPQYVDGTPANIRALPFDPVLLEGTVTVAMHPARLGNPVAPPVPFNVDTPYLGAPLIQSTGE